jgi:hypothetical protein
MPRRLRLILPLLILLIGLSIVLFGFLYIRHHTERAVLESIKKGMSRTEIESKLGGPPGDYRTKKENIPLPLGSKFDMYEAWDFDEGLLFVRFNGDDRATSVHLIDNHPLEKSIPDRIHDWLFR